jgi:hypothetical protein
MTVAEKEYQQSGLQNVKGAGSIVAVAAFPKLGNPLRAQRCKGLQIGGANH